LYARRLFQISEPCFAVGTSGRQGRASKAVTSLAWSRTLFSGAKQGSQCSSFRFPRLGKNRKEEHNMEKTLTTNKTSKLNILRSGDPKTSFGDLSPAEILDKFGPPKSLLSSSLKTDKCLSVFVMARVL
jgi:hypothetical protein